MSEQIFFCCAPTREGGKCKNRVAAEGLRCYIKSHALPSSGVAEPAVTAPPTAQLAANAPATGPAIPAVPPAPQGQNRKAKFRGKGMTWEEARRNGFIRPLPVLELVTHEDPDLDALACLWLAQEKQAEVMAKVGLEGGRMEVRFSRDDVPAELGKRLVFDIGDGNPAAGVFSNHPVATFPERSSLDLFWDWLGLADWSSGAVAIRQTVRLHDTKGQYLQGLRTVRSGQLRKRLQKREALAAKRQLDEWRESHLVYLLKGLNQHFRQQPEMVAKLVGRVFSAIAASGSKTDDDLAAARLVLDRCLAIWVLKQYLHRYYPWSPAVKLEPQRKDETLLVYLDRQLLQVKLGRQTVAEKLAQQEHRGAPGVHSQRIVAILGINAQRHYYDQHLASLAELAGRINSGESLSPPATGEMGGQKFTVTDWEQQFILVNMVAALLKHPGLTGEEVLEVVFAFYDALEALGKDYQQASADCQAGRYYQLPVLGKGRRYGLRVGVFHSSTRQIGEYARAPGQNCQLILVRTHEGCIYLQPDKRLHLSLQGVIKALRVQEAERRGQARPAEGELTAEGCPLGVWHYHVGRIMNGSLKRVAVPTVLSLQEIEDCVREGLAAP